MSQLRLEEFARELHEDVLRKTGDDERPQLREETFTEEILERLAEHNEADGADVCHHFTTAGRHAAKLNAWMLSADGSTLDLFVARYFGTGQVEELSLPETRRHFQLVRRFLTLARDGFHKKIEESSDGFRPGQQIYAKADSLTTVRLFLLTDGVVRQQTLDMLASEDEELIPGVDVRPVIWDLEKLSRLRVGEREMIELDFENGYGGSIPCLAHSDPTGEYRTFLAYFPADLLARIYGEYGQRLLERNVRAFLQARGKVNKGLQTTIKDEPHRFLAYNNGLCCTAAEVRVKAERDGHALLDWVKDFQIVNGGQTTASIYHSLKKQKLPISQVFVQVKLTVLSDPTKVADIVPLISRYANSQNKVNTADFSANGPFHRSLEQLSRMVWAPAASGLERLTHWYYERARGSYSDDKARQGPPQSKCSEWESQNPKHQMFTKTDLAKFENAWMCLPHLVCRGNEKNFKEFADRMNDEGEPEINPNYFKHMIARAILFRTTGKLFTALKLKDFGAPSVAYTVAWLAEHSGWRINLDGIWETQHLSSVLCDAMKIVCAAAHKHISEQDGNPGEVSKREACWNEFNRQELPLGDAWRNELVDTPFLPLNSEDSALASEWESVRHQFTGDARAIAELEALTGKTWIASRRREPICRYTDRTWEKLQAMPGLGPKRIRGLVEMISAAGRG